MPTLSKQEIRKEKVIKAAQELFAANGIESTTIQDIADHADIGVASVYRYYSNKQTIAVKAGIDLWRLWNRNMTRYLFDASTGIGKIEQVIDVAFEFFHENPDFLRFIDSFDTFISSMETPPEEMEKYQDMINYNQPKILSLVAAGLQDGTIRNDLDLESTFTTIIHTILCLAQKLFIRGNIIPQDSNLSPEVELNVLKQMILSYIAAR